MADSQMRIYAVIGNLHAIVVRRNLFLIPVGANNGTQFTTLRNTQTKGATFTMISDNNWQTI